MAIKRRNVISKWNARQDWTVRRKPGSKSQFCQLSICQDHVRNGVFISLLVAWSHGRRPLTANVKRLGKIRMNKFDANRILIPFQCQCKCEIKLLIRCVKIFYVSIFVQRQRTVIFVVGVCFNVYHWYPIEMFLEKVRLCSSVCQIQRWRRATCVLALAYA